MGKVILLFCLLGCFCADAQTVEDNHHRILIVLDASLSMQEAFNNTTRYKAATDFISQLMDSVYTRNDEVEFGLRVYGHQYATAANYCYDTKFEVQYSRNNYDQMKLRLADIQPRGISNTFYALSEALDNDIHLRDGYVYHLVVITDGGEACSGDVCALKERLAYKQVVEPCIISLADKPLYACIGNALSMTADKSKLITSLLQSCCTVPYKKAIVQKKEIVQTIPLPEKKLIKQDSNALRSAQSKTLDVEIAIPAAQLIALPELPVNKETGYLKVTGTTGMGTIRIYEYVNGSYKLYKTMQVSTAIINQRIPLPVGKYKLVYEIGSSETIKEFRVLKGMITEISVTT